MSRYGLCFIKIATEVLSPDQSLLVVQARTTVQAHLMRSDLLVEATAIAAVFK